LSKPNSTFAQFEVSGPLFTQRTMVRKDETPGMESPFYGWRAAYFRERVERAGTRQAVKESQT
jgi:hypothetical protein